MYPNDAQHPTSSSSYFATFTSGATFDGDREALLFLQLRGDGRHYAFSCFILQTGRADRSADRLAGEPFSFGHAVSGAFMGRVGRCNPITPPALADGNLWVSDRHRRAFLGDYTLLVVSTGNPVCIFQRTDHPVGG